MKNGPSMEFKPPEQILGGAPLRSVAFYGLWLNPVKTTTTTAGRTATRDRAAAPATSSRTASQAGAPDTGTSKTGAPDARNWAWHKHELQGLNDEGWADEEKPGEKRSFEKAGITEPERCKPCTCHWQGTTLRQESYPMLDAVYRIKRLFRAVKLQGN